MEVTLEQHSAARALKGTAKILETFIDGTPQTNGIPSLAHTLEDTCNLFLLSFRFLLTVGFKLLW